MTRPMLASVAHCVGTAAQPTRRAFWLGSCKTRSIHSKIQAQITGRLMAVRWYLRIEQGGVVTPLYDQHEADGTASFTSSLHKLGVESQAKHSPHWYPPPCQERAERVPFSLTAAALFTARGMHRPCPVAPA